MSAVEAVVEALRAIRAGEWTPPVRVAYGLAEALDELQASGRRARDATG